MPGGQHYRKRRKPGGASGGGRPDKIVVVSTSPAVRASLGEEFGMEPGAFVEGKMVALLRALGADYVLDTNFAADLTIVEEASELVRRIKEGGRPLPQFTSCCPGWVRFAEIYAPELLPHLSTAKSPIGMQGPTVKTYFAQKNGPGSPQDRSCGADPLHRPRSLRYGGRRCTQLRIITA